MKIRTDFVTNSSSSSYVIAFKGLPKIDEETLNKYPFLRQYQIIIKETIMGGEGGSYETSPAELVDNLIDLQYLLLKEYGYSKEGFYEMIESDDYVRNIYEKCEDKLEDGYQILFKDVGYDDFREGLFEKLQSDDFVIIDGAE